MQVHIIQIKYMYIYFTNIQYSKFPNKRKIERGKLKIYK